LTYGQESVAIEPVTGVTRELRIISSCSGHIGVEWWTTDVSNGDPLGSIEARVFVGRLKNRTDDLGSS
jgi:hypothetical protein